MNTGIPKKSNRRLFFGLVILVILMFGFGFALVPLYNVLCKTLGINGKTQQSASEQAQAVDTKRSITVEFTATTNASLPWSFYPEVKKITIHPGENKLIAYYAKNNSNHTMTVQAIPSVSPGVAAKYLKKTECFCFTQQTFKAGESRDMPVLFHIDNELPKQINTITLSYTMFDTAQIKSTYNKPSRRIE